MGLVLCVAASSCTTNSVRRAALVPHQQPIAHSGAALDTSEFSIGSPTLLRTGEPTLSSNRQDAGIAIPRFTGQGGIRIPIPSAKNASFGIHGEYGRGKSATQLSDDQPTTQGNVIGGAFSSTVTVTLSPQWDIGLGWQFWMYSVPLIEYSTCIDCTIGVTRVEHTRELVSVVSAAILPTFHFNDDVDFFGGITARNHPTAEKSSIEPERIIDDEAVQFGPGNAIISLGADVRLSDRIKLTGFVYQPVSRDPARYGASGGVTLTIFGPKPASPAAAAP